MRCDARSRDGKHIPIRQGPRQPLRYCILPSKMELSDLTDDGGTVVYDNVECGVTLEVETANIYQSGKDLDSRCGIVFFPQKWNLSGTLRAGRDSARHTSQCDPLPR